ncbi:hypothetical protein CB1_000526020 [Camelus ferus]|nr:hypothetical protein CB1_000526020 [Camelus ferus]
MYKAKAAVLLSKDTSDLPVCLPVNKLGASSSNFTALEAALPGAALRAEGVRSFGPPPPLEQFRGSLTSPCVPSRLSLQFVIEKRKALVFLAGSESSVCHREEKEEESSFHTLVSRDFNPFPGFTHPYLADPDVLPTPAFSWTSSKSARHLFIRSSRVSDCFCFDRNIWEPSRHSWMCALTKEFRSEGEKIVLNFSPYLKRESKTPLQPGIRQMSLLGSEGKLEQSGDTKALQLLL